MALCEIGRKLAETVGLTDDLFLRHLEEPCHQCHEDVFGVRSDRFKVKEEKTPNTFWAKLVESR